MASLTTGLGVGGCLGKMGYMLPNLVNKRIEKNAAKLTPDP